MALALPQALGYSALPALAGFVAGVLLMAPHWPAAQKAQRHGMLLVLMAMGLTGPIFCLVASILASQVPGGEALTWRLVALGAAAAVQAVAQGFTVRAGFPAVLLDARRFGPLLVRAVLPEVLTILALVWFILGWAPLAPAAA